MDPKSPEDWLDQLEDADPTVRGDAIEALSRARDLRALPAFRRLAQTDESEDVRLRARKALAALAGPPPPAGSGGLDPSTGSGELREALGAPDPELRHRAIETIAQRGDISFLPLLLERVDREEDSRCRSVLASTLGAVGNRSVIAPLATFLLDPDATVRVSALVGFLSLDDVAAYPYIVRMLPDPDPAVRAYVLKTLARLGRINLLKVCAAMLRHDEAWMQDSAVFCLAASRMPEAIPLLESALASSRLPVRERALSGLGLLAREGHDRARELVERSAGMPEPAVASEIQASEDLSEKIPARRLSSEDPSDRLVAIREMVKAKDPDTLVAFSRRLQGEGDPKVLASLVLAVGQLGDPNGEPLVSPFLGHADTRIRANAVEALGLIQGRRMKNLIAPLLQDRNNRVRANAIVALADVTDVDVHGPLEELFIDEDPIHRRSGIWAAAAVATARAVELIERSVEDADESVRSRSREILELLSAEGVDEATAALGRTIDPSESVSDFDTRSTLVEGYDSSKLDDAVDEIYEETISGRIQVRGALRALVDAETAASALVRTLATLRFDQEAYIRCLSADLEDDDPDIRRRALSILERFAPVLDLLGRIRILAAVDPQRDIRQRARDVLRDWEGARKEPGPAGGEIEPPATREEALHLMARSEWLDRLSLAFALESRKVPWLEDLLIDRLRVERDPWVLAAHCRVLGEAGSQASIPLLQTCLFHQDPRVVVEAMEALHLLEAPLLMGHVKDLVRSETPRIQIRAIRVLACYEPERALQLLGKIALSEDRARRSALLHVIEGLDHPEASRMAARMLGFENQLDLVEREVEIAGRHPDPEIHDLISHASRRASDEIEPLLAPLKKKLDLQYGNVTLSDSRTGRRVGSADQAVGVRETRSPDQAPDPEEELRSRIKTLLGTGIVAVILVLVVIGLIVAR